MSFVGGLGRAQLLFNCGREALILSVVTDPTLHPLSHK